MAEFGQHLGIYLLSFMRAAESELREHAGCTHKTKGSMLTLGTPPEIGVRLEDILVTTKKVV